MNAIVYRDYGSPDVLRYEEIEKPVPAADQVLIRVRAAAVNPLDWHYMRGTPYFMRVGTGFGKPKEIRLGVDMAGRVESAGCNITRLRPGDEVFGTAKGALAEYACAPEKALAPKPANLTFEQAASIPVAGAYTALQALRDHGHIQAGQSVLVNGAAGGVGTFGVQIAKAFGAKVTGVCSTRNVDMVRSIGADQVIDYTKADFTESGERYDLILDCMGNRPISALRRVMTARGTYTVVGGPDGKWLGPLAALLRAQVCSWFVRQELKPVMARPCREDLLAMKELVEAGKMRPVIDRCYPLAEAAEAMRYLEQGHARGKVVVSI